jgi:predicted RNase H-like HicB family nuclease
MRIIITYCFAYPYEGGYLEFTGEDIEPLRANTREELMERLEEAKALWKAHLPGHKLLIVKEEITIEEIK